MLGQKRLFGNHVDGAKGLFQRRNRLEIPHDANLLTIRDSAFHSAGPVRQAVKTPLLGIVSDFVVGN